MELLHSFPIKGIHVEVKIKIYAYIYRCAFCKIEANQIPTPSVLSFNFQMM
jgi:hypothetical protein